MHMVAGAVSRRQPGSTEPFLGRKRRQHSYSVGSCRKRRRVHESGTDSESEADSVGGSVAEDDAFSVASSDVPSRASEAGYSDAGTDATLSGGEEAEDDAPVPKLADVADEYEEVFGDKPTHDAVLEVVCLAAALMGKLCGDNQEEGQSLSEVESKELAKEAYEFVTKCVRVLFGAVNTTKMHTLAYHLHDELMRRGNVIKADTSVNEALHKLIKIMWTNTNKQEASFTIQMLKCEQTLSHIIESDMADKAAAAHGGGDIRSRARPTAAAAGGVECDGVGDPDGIGYRDWLNGGFPEEDDGSPMDLSFDGRGGDVEADVSEEGVDEDIDVDDTGDVVQVGIADQSSRAAAAVGSFTEDAPARRPRRIRISGRRITVADAAAADNGRLQQLPALLGTTAAQHLVVVNTFKIEAKLPWRVKKVAQLVRAARSLYRKPWFDHVYYDVPGDRAEQRLGLARLLVRAVSGVRRDLLVVQRMESADHQSTCVLSLFKCRRYQWVMDPTTGFPALDVVPLSDVVRLEHVVPDFADLGRRWGLLGTPATTPDTPYERRRERYFTNAFFPWTTNSIGDAP